jgi:cytochrome c oxidase subunit 2
VKNIITLIFGLGILVILVACSSTNTSPEFGQNLALIKGCSACHSVDDIVKIGPPWRGLYGSQVELNGGGFVTADEGYLRESIETPNAKIVKGFTKGSMPPISLTGEEIDALVAYIKSVE